MYNVEPLIFVCCNKETSKPTTVQTTRESKYISLFGFVQYKLRDLLVITIVDTAYSVISNSCSCKFDLYGMFNSAFVVMTHLIALQKVRLLIPKSNVLGFNG